MAKSKPRECRHCGNAWTRTSRAESLTFCPDCDVTVARCSSCDLTKPVAEFHSNTTRRSGRDSNCRSCVTDRKLLHRYGITRGQYDALLLEQGGNCAICGLPPEEGQPLHVDHCHTDLRVRGLLCSKCNTAIGLLQEDLDVIQASWNYIKSNQALVS